MHKIGLSLFAGALMFGALACDDGAADRIDNRIKCRKICEQVEKCSSGFDEDECAEECRDLALDDDTEVKVDNCADCVETDNSCVENTVQCASECTGIVVLSS